MKNLNKLIYSIILTACLSMITITVNAQVLDLQSTTEGALLPRMTTAERTAIGSPSQSETVYDTDTKSFWYWEDMQWNELGASSGSGTPFIVSGEGISGDTLRNTLPAVKDTITLTSTEMIMDDVYVTVCLDITHSYVGDLDISLISPSSGVTIDLTSDNGGTGNNFKQTCFTSTATTPITSILSSDAPFTGVYLPEGSFSTLIGQPINGDWTLEVVDDVGGDDGILNSWTINFTNSFSFVAQKALYANSAELANSANSAKSVADTDNDTKIQVEENPDEDVIRFDIDGSEQLTLKNAPNGSLIFDLDNSNVLMGSNVGDVLAAGTQNIFIGNNAGKDMTDGFKNTFIGTDSGINKPSGNDNIFIGADTGEANSTGGNNVFIGNTSGRLNTGSNNTFLGRYSGDNNTGSNNVFLGYAAGSSELTGSNKLYIANTNTSSPLIYGEFDNGFVRVQGNLHTKDGSGFFGEDSAGLGASYGKGVRVYVEQPSDKGRIFAYDYGAGATMDLTLQATGGDVAIGGTFADGYRLSVNGKIACEEVLVEMSGSWPDYVFKSDYNLLSLEEVASHIESKGHLPGVPSALEVEDNGIKVAEMNKILMEKIEELTLYILDQEKRIKSLESSKN